MIVEAIDVAGTRIAYTERGSGTPVLLIHGSGTYSATFEPVLDELPENVRAIAYDRRGFGASAGALSRRLAEHIDDAAALLEALDARPAIVVGPSAGGVLALRLAVARPELVSGLVLIEPAYQMTLVPSASASAAIAGVHLRWLLRRDPVGAALSFYRWASGYAAGGNQFDSYPEEWRRTALGHARAALRDLGQVAPPSPSRSALGRIAVPTVVVIGNAGRSVFHRTSRRALRAIPGAWEVPAPGAAHIAYTDQPSICANAIVEVARQVSGLGGLTRSGPQPSSGSRVSAR